MQKEVKIKNMTVRIPKDLWAFLKKVSVEEEKPMNVILLNLLAKYQERREKDIDMS